MKEQNPTPNQRAINKLEEAMNVCDLSYTEFVTILLIGWYRQGTTDLNTGKFKKEEYDCSSPVHAHEKPGFWESDMGVLFNKPCAECSLWDLAKTLYETQEN